MLAQRVLSAVVLAPLVLLVVAAGSEPFAVVVGFAIVIATWEFYALIQRAGYTPLRPFGVVLGLAFLADAYLPGSVLPPVLAACLLISLSYLVLARQVDRRFADWALTWVPPLYVGFLGSMFLSLRLLPGGEHWVYLAFAVTWATDIGAYLVGSTVGRHSFFSKVSPHKTVEGALGGILSGLIAGGVLGVFFEARMPVILAISVLAALAAEIGDLSESLVKRQLRVKDSGALIPGHGGLLDRIDSALFVGVVVYYWAVFVGGMQ